MGFPFVSGHAPLLALAVVLWARAALSQGLAPSPLPGSQAEQDQGGARRPAGQALSPALFRTRLDLGEGRLTLRITNQSGRDVAFVRPLADSFLGPGVNVSPVYLIEARDGAKRPLRQVLVEAPDPTPALEIDGSRSITLLAHGKTFSSTFSLPLFWGEPTTVQVTYEFEMNDLPMPRRIPLAARRRMAQLFVGRLSSNKVRLSVEHPFPFVPGPMVVMGSMPRELVTGVMYESRGAISRCLDPLIRAGHKLGAGTLQFMVGRDGKAFLTAVEPNSGRSAIADCLTGWINGLDFPKSGTGMSRVSFPFRIPR